MSEYIKSEFVTTCSTSSQTRRVIKEYIHTCKISDFMKLVALNGHSVKGGGKLNEQNLWIFTLQFFNFENEMTIRVEFVKQVVKITNIPYLFSMFFIDSNEKEHEVFKLTEYNLKTIHNTYKYSNSNYQDKIEFYYRLKHVKKNMLPNGDLIIRFKIYFNVIEMFLNPESMQITTNSSKTNLQCEEFKNIINDEIFNGDIKIIVGNKVLWAFKANLVNQSPVFAAMFEHDMRENNRNVIVIEEFNYKVVQEMLRFISVGKVNKIKNIAHDLLVAADKYDLKQLKIMCEETLSNDLNLETMIGLSIFAEKYGADVLKDNAANFLKLHIEEISKNRDYKTEIKTLLPLLPKIIQSLLEGES